MQINQSPLGNNVHPLGIISSLSDPQRMLLRKESHSLHSRSNFISLIQTKPPLVTSSKFLLSNEHEPSMQSLIGWDTQDINSKFSLLDFDSSDSTTPLENSNSRESRIDSISEIMPTRIDKKTSNHTLEKPNIQGKANSKKTNKSQQPSKTKSKSRTKKPIQSSAAKNVEQSFDENNITVNRKKDKLLASNELLSVENNSEIPILKQDIASGNTTNDSDYISSTMPSTTAPTSPIVEDLSLLNNINNNELQGKFEVISSVPSANSSLTESILPLQKNIELENNTSELVENSPREFPLDNNVEEIFTSDSNLTNKVITEASQVVNIPDVPVSPTPSEQDIETSQTTSIVDNQTTASQTNLIQAKEVPSSVTSPLQQESPHTNSNFEAITAVEPNLISESIGNNFVRDNAIVDNSLTLSSALNSPDVDDAPSLFTPLINDKNTVLTDVAISNSESSVAKSPITIQQEIDSSVLSEFPASTPVQLTPTSAEIEDTPSLSKNSENNEQLVTLESQSAMAVNVSDVSANVTSLQRDSYLDSTNEFTESQPILALPSIGETALAPLPTTSPEIGETPTISATSPEIGETAIAPLPTTSPEIGETPTITATSPEIGETPTISATSPGIDETAIAPLPTTSPEIGETPTITATSPEIGETPTISATSPEIGETAIASLPTTSPEIGETPTISATSPGIDETAIAPLSTTSPEIGETSTISATSPEIGETAIAPLSTTSPEIGETPTISATSPEIGETAIAPLSTTSPEIGETAIAPLSTTSPEIGETPTISATSPEIGETASIFRKTIDNEQTVESEFPFAVTNPEISTFVDTPDNPTSPHDEVSTPPEVEKNSLQTPNFKESEEKTSPETPTKVDSFPDTSLQLKSAETHLPQISNSLIPSSLRLDIGKQKLSSLNSPQLNPLQNQTSDIGEPSPQYSSPPLIFRKAHPSTNTSSQWSNTPSQWSSVEDLLNGNNDEFTSFNFSDVESNSQNYESSQVSESPQVFAKHLPSSRSFANGGEVIPPDISREIEPITETIESVSSSSQEDDKDDTADVEALAREIYNRLRQRIEIERERHGGHSGRFPW